LATFPVVGLETVRAQTQVEVLQREMMASEPPMARYVPVGERAMAVQEEVCAAREWRGVRVG
jgi:hypothetical protein